MVTEVSSLAIAPVEPLHPETSLAARIFDELAEIAAQHKGEHVALETDDLVFRHAIQALTEPATPWEIAQSIPQTIRGEDVTDADVLNKLMGIDGSLDRLRAAGALTPEELANVRDVRSFLAQDPTYQRMLAVESPTIQKAINLGIRVVDTLPGAYEPEERAIILTGGLKYLAEGVGFVGTRERVLPQFGGKWESLGVSTMNMLLNQHKAITTFPTETIGFVGVYLQTLAGMQNKEQPAQISWLRLPLRTPRPGPQEATRRR